MELADLEKIMDSFENEEEEKIIGTIVKIDNEGLHGISDSPPRITLKDSVSSVNPQLCLTKELQALQLNWTE